eukprot:TRINITY_DN2881_c0_g2_i1.p2 TRINITY_DN2881_c0_g2~~TRINITY_DN2881_c0_g2_i1.p2  ORF type:complete len:121 (+),score=7.04 TRINITY_DN2881_c0_g2_i1:283-645(+)
MMSCGGGSFGILLFRQHQQTSPNLHTGDTPLHNASNEGHLEVAKLLVESKADVDAKDDDGMLFDWKNVWVDFRKVLMKKLIEGRWTRMRGLSGISAFHGTGVWKGEFAASHTPRVLLGLR